MSKYLCTNCGHTAEREIHNLYMTKAIECPKCKKRTFIVVNKYPKELAK